MDRLAHLNQLLADLEAQLAGLETALALAPLEDKARLRLLVQKKQQEIQPYAEEKAQLEAGQKSVTPLIDPGVLMQGIVRAVDLLRRVTIDPQAIVTQPHKPATLVRRDPLSVFSSYSSYTHADKAVYYDLIIRCPACLGEGKEPEPASQWFHDKCGGKMQIGDDAQLKCVKCGDSFHIKFASYVCQLHPTHFRPAKAASFVTSISVSGQMSDNIMNIQWMRELLSNMDDDW